MTNTVNVKVDYRGYGREGNPNNTQPEVLVLPKLLSGKKEKLEFDLPTPDAFDPDCEFDIIIDEKGSLESWESGVCFGEH